MIRVKRIVSLEPGVYEATLRKIYERQKKEFRTDDVYDAISFDYEISVDGEDPITLTRDNRNTLGPKSNLLKDIKAMAGERATDEVLASDESFNALLETLVRKRYLIQTGSTESGNPKIVAVLAKPKAKATSSAPVRKPAPVAEADFGDDEPPALEDDDIPF